jgi:putative ABC transport system permease protein
MLVHFHFQVKVIAIKDVIEIIHNLAAELFSQMFLVFGSFSIIAGVILIVNIFVMLGEERKGEMGISRAVGMSRGDLKRSFVYEGSLYSIVSSLVGAGLGVGVAYIVLMAMNTIFGKWFDDTSIIDSFTFQNVSLVHAFTFGMLISLVTVSFAASRINKLNIVRAIRNIPEPKIPKESNKILLLGSFLILTGLGLFGSGLVLFDDLGLGNFEAAGIYTGISLSVIGGALVARRVVGDRIAYSTMSIILIVFWLVPSKILGLDGYGGDMEMFVLSGLFAVSAGIILFIFNSHQLMSIITKLWSMTGRPTATIRTASSYPMKNRFRTGLTIYMFALIVFTITVMSMIVGVLSANIERITEEQMGEIEIVGMSSSHFRIEDIEIMIEENNELSMEDFESIYSLSSGNVILDNGKAHSTEEGNQTMQWTLMGVGQEFKDSGWSFKEMMDGYDTDEEVWDALQTDDSLAVVDATFTQTDDDMGPDYFSFPLKSGDRVRIITPNGEEEKTIIAVMDQEMLEGIFVSRSSASEQFNLTDPNFFMFDLASGVDDDEMAKDIERELGLQTIVLSTMVERITSSMEQMFNLFSAFMGLGLVVGIAGLGIITLRAVHERRVEIGMMRAIGFQRHSVTWSFLMEAGFIASAGILLGSILGMFIGYTLWYDEFKPIDFEFYIPWMKIVLVGLFSLASTLVFTLLPSFSASTVAPAEALRYD